MAQSKLQQRTNWIIEHKAEIEAARTPETGSNKNAAHRDGMSAGGWGYWAQAFEAANVYCHPMNYWSGSAPTPSTAINRGIANYISTNAPETIR